MKAQTQTKKEKIVSLRSEIYEKEQHKSNGADYNYKIVIL